MPHFDTPEPISVILEFDVGLARIIASDRADTAVEVLPNDASNEIDAVAAQQVNVTYSRGKLLVKGVKKRSLFGKSGSLDISIALPAGSDVNGTAPLADFVCEGRLGECGLRTSAGDIQVDTADSVRLRTGHGDIRVDRVTGDADVSGAGRVDVGDIGGTATVKNVHGETTVRDVTGDLRAHSSNGRIAVGVTHAGVEVKSAYGSIRVGELARGRTVLQTASGDVEIGIHESTAAWLDVDTRLGSVRNALGPSEGPGKADDTVEVRARTGMGDIIIRRADLLSS